MVDGYHCNLSSAHGEIQGQTAAATLIHGLNKTLNTSNVTIQLFGDNQGVQNKCKRQTVTKLRSHRDPNADLFMEYHAVTSTFNPKVHWVRSHQDKDTPLETIEDLKELKLSPEATLNMWCDKQAEIACQEDISYPDADILPAEKWALFTTTPDYYEITGKLNEAITTTLHFEPLQKFIAKKHGPIPEKIQDTNTTNRCLYLKRLRPHTRANTVKLMHRWIPRNSFLCSQGCSKSDICPRCEHAPEKAEHIHAFADPVTCQERTTLLYQALSDLEQAEMPSFVLNTMEHHLTKTLNVDSQHQYNITQELTYMEQASLRDAVHHQTLLGWHSFLCGYTSNLWNKLANGPHTTKKHYWESKLTTISLNLHRAIWEG